MKDTTPILVKSTTKQKLSEAKEILRKTWDDFLVYLLEFYISHADEDDRELDKADVMRYCVSSPDTSSLEFHRDQLTKILTDLEHTYATTGDPKDKATIAEKIARINASLKDISKTDESSRVLEEIAQIKKNRLKILKNIAPTKTVKRNEDKEEVSETESEQEANN